jgi:enoyl-CoA hydratase/carnithine racemase
MSVIDVAVTEKIATITLNRPDALNSFTDDMERELIEAYEKLDRDDGVRVIVLTGAGRAFCAGMDLSAAGSTFTDWRTSADAPAGTQWDIGPGRPPARRDGGGRVVLAMFHCRKPIIAAINGPAVGVGITMTLPADIRIASESARIGFVFGRRGLVPESCSTWFLPRLVPMQQALEWVLTGRVFGASEALRAGLVRSVHPELELLPAAYALAAEMTKTAPVSAALTRQLMWQMRTAPHPMYAHIAETHALNLLGLSADGVEGIRSFVEKRPAVFPGTVSGDYPDVLGGLPEPDFTPPPL